MAGAVAPGWYLIIDSRGRPGAENMAVDHALLPFVAKTGSTIVRLYTWDPPCLSFGRNEPALRRYDRRVIERRGLSVVRRPTGGRAVWHEHELTYAVAAPTARWGTLRQSYLAIHEVLAQGLRYLGADAHLAPATTTAPLTAGACFATSVGGEVLIGGKKVIGSAQWREADALLQHGSILLDGSQSIVQSLSGRFGAPASATTLRAVLDRVPTFAETAEALTAAIREAWGPPRRGAPTLPGFSTAPFGTDAWTWRR